jgi:hypothetical protein
VSDIGQRLIAAVREIAAERPDHVYDSESDEGCVYIDKDGNPSCIIGHAGYKLALITREPQGCWDSTDICAVSYELRWSLSNDELRWLSAVQTHQDRGVSWGAAVELADAEVAA